MAKPIWYEARTEIAKFALPLIEKMSAKHNGYPGRMSDQFNGDGDLANAHWEEILNDIEWALRHIANDTLFELKPKEYQKVEDSMKLFGEWFLDLWD